MTANNFDAVLSAPQFFGQQLYQRFIGRRIHRRRGDMDFHFISLWAANLVFRRARLHFYGKQNAVWLRRKKDGKCHGAGGNLFIFRIDKFECRRRERPAAEIADKIDPEA